MTCLLVRAALTLFVLPFLVGGMLLAGVVCSWFYESALFQSIPRLWMLLLPILTLAGIVLGGLVAYGIIIFFLSWLLPNSPLLVRCKVVNPRLTLRILYPAIHVVGRFARWMAPKPSR